MNLILPVFHRHDQRDLLGCICDDGHGRIVLDLTSGLAQEDLMLAPGYRIMESHTDDRAELVVDKVQLLEVSIL